MESHDVSGAGGIPSEEAFGTPGVRRVASLGWLAEGFLRAAARFEEGAGRIDRQARETFIPLFEALNWAVTIAFYLQEHEGPVETPLLRALRFARNRVHHQWADALESRTLPMDERIREAAAAAGVRELFDWYWRPLHELPSGRPDPEGEGLYRELLAGNPASMALDELGRFFEGLVS